MFDLQPRGWVSTKARSFAASASLRDNFTAAALKPVSSNPCPELEDLYVTVRRNIEFFGPGSVFPELEQMWSCGAIRRICQPGVVVDL